MLSLDRLRQDERILANLPATLHPWPWLGLICALLFLPGLLSIPLSDVGESQVVMAALRLLEGGGIDASWPQALAVRLTEASRIVSRHAFWAYRLPSLGGALLAVATIYLWGRHLLGARAGFIAAILMASSLGLVVSAHLAGNGTLHLAGATAALGLLLQAMRRPDSIGPWRAAGFWLLIALAIPLQRPAMALLPLLAALAPGIRDLPGWRALRPMAGCGILAAVAAGWSGLTGAAPWAGIEMLSLPPGTGLLALPIAAFPGGWITLLAMPAAWRNRAEPSTRALLAWAGAGTLLAAVPGGAPDGHVLAVLPALALLGAGWAANQGEPAPAHWLDRLGRLQLAMLALGLGLGTLLVAGIDRRMAPFGLVALLGAMLMAWRMMVLARSGRWGGAAVSAAFLVAPVYAVIIAGPLTRLPIAWIVPRIAGTAQRVAPGLPPEDFAVAGFTGQSMLFHTGRAARLLPDGPAAARFLAGHPGRLAAVAGREEAAFRQAAVALGLTVQEAATVVSFDLLHGSYVAMLLYRKAG